MLKVGSGSIKAPSLLLTALELRTAVELGISAVLSPLLKLAPGGDGGPVLVVPGFTAGDATTAPLRAALNIKGYSAEGWDLGPNIGPTTHLMDGVQDRLRQLAYEYGEPVRVVGWSLGGIYARYLARMNPEMVRQVITLGSPFRMREGDRSTVSFLMDALSRFYAYEYFEHLANSEDNEDLLVPSTAIYSKTDGIVAWEACLEYDTSDSESIEVYGAHAGLGHHPAAVYAILDRLAQPVNGWQKFCPPSALAHQYPRPEHAPIHDDVPNLVL